MPARAVSVTASAASCAFAVALLLMHHAVWRFGRGWLFVRFIIYWLWCPAVGFCALSSVGYKTQKCRCHRFLPAGAWKAALLRALFGLVECSYTAGRSGSISPWRSCMDIPCAVRASVLSMGWMPHVTIRFASKAGTQRGGDAPQSEVTLCSVP